MVRLSVYLSNTNNNPAGCHYFLYVVFKKRYFLKLALLTKGLLLCLYMKPDMAHAVDQNSKNVEELQSSLLCFSISNQH